MTLTPSRRNTLESLRKRDLAQALRNLKKSAEDLLKIDEELVLLQGQIVSIQDKLSSKPGPREVLAGDLEAEMLRHDRLAVLGDQLMGRKAKLKEEKKRLGILVNTSKDEVAKAKRALGAVEEKRT